MNVCSRIVEFLLWLLLFAAIVILSLIPSEQAGQAVMLFGGDKIAHALAYTALGLFTYLLVTPELKRRSYRIALAVGFCVIAGIIIELIQPYFGRECEILDMAVNASATVLGVLLALLLLKFMPDWFS